MMRHLLTGLLVVASACALPAAEPHPLAAERSAAAALLVNGQPDPDATAAGTAAATLAERVTLRRELLRQDAARQDAVAQRARRDAFGSASAPNGAPVPAAAAPYFEQLKQYVAFLGAQPSEYRAVIDRAYQLVIRRAAYPEEHDYWKTYGTLPYVALVGAIENWAVRNQPGLMVTTGVPAIAVNSRFLLTQRVSPTVANEARELLGLPVWSDVARQHNPGRNIVAVAAGEIESVGGVHFLLAGGSPLMGER